MTPDAIAGVALVIGGVLGFPIGAYWIRRREAAAMDALIGRAQVGVRDEEWCDDGDVCGFCCGFCDAGEVAP